MWEFNIKSLQSIVSKQTSFIDQLIDETESQKIQIIDLKEQVEHLTKLVYTLIPEEKLKLSSKDLLKSTLDSEVTKETIEDIPDFEMKTI